MTRADATLAGPRAVGPPQPRPALLEVRDLRLAAGSGAAAVPILHGVDLTVGQGEILGLVGESGSGKSVTCLSLLRLLGKRMTARGEILFQGRNLLALDEAAMVEIRGREIAMIIQEPQSGLNPVQTLGRQLVEALSPGRLPWRAVARYRQRATDLLRDVGMPDPASRLALYPHELSGGQAQRALIAMMLARGPRLLLADEPTTALDVTVQAQILALLRRLRRDHDMAILLVTHDLGVVAETCDRVAVMYCGRVVESGSTRAVFRAPRHPYTAGLLGARPRVDRRVSRLTAIEGVVPSPLDLPAGCSFAPRCPNAGAECRTTAPPWQASETGGYACHHPLPHGGGRP